MPVLWGFRPSGRCLQGPTIDWGDLVMEEEVLEGQVQTAAVAPDTGLRAVREAVANMMKDLGKMRQHPLPEQQAQSHPIAPGGAPSQGDDLVMAGDQRIAMVGTVAVRDQEPDDAPWRTGRSGRSHPPGLRPPAPVGRVAGGHE